MELIKSTPNVIIPEEEVIQESHGNFIEANTSKVTIEHLKNDCIIPVFSKDNETTISHFEFIHSVHSALSEVFNNRLILKPDIRVSHVIKGRIPSAIGKPAKDLLEHEKTIYWERMAFMFELPEITRIINGNKLTLMVGGVRAYNLENLYSRKGMEKFKIFIGFKNMVCCNMCISTDGYYGELRVSAIDQLIEKSLELFSTYNVERHMEAMEFLGKYQISEKQFAHLMGKLKMASHAPKLSNRDKMVFDINDGQITNVIKNYYTDDNFCKSMDNSLNLWNLYNLFTGANKSSYIHNNIDRNVGSFEFCTSLANSLDSNVGNWFLN